LSCSCSGDFGEVSHDGNFCLNGLNFPDRGLPWALSTGNLRRVTINSSRSGQTGTAAGTNNNVNNVKLSSKAAMFYNKYFSGGTNTSNREGSTGQAGAVGTGTGPLSLSSSLPTVLPSSSSSRDLNSSVNLAGLDKGTLDRTYQKASGIATNPYGLGGLSVARSPRPGSGGSGTRERYVLDLT